jgi:hypothetical protein
MLKSKVFRLFFIASFSLFFFTECNKDQTCRAQITVVDKNGAIASGASVTLFVAPISTFPNIEVTKTTNANGLAEFAYKDPVILNIKAVLGQKRSDTTELIKLERGKTVQKTVAFIN